MGDWTAHDRRVRSFGTGSKRNWSTDGGGCMPRAPLSKTWAGGPSDRCGGLEALGCRPREKERGGTTSELPPPGMLERGPPSLQPGRSRWITGDRRRPGRGRHRSLRSDFVRADGVEGETSPGESTAAGGGMDFLRSRKFWPACSGEGEVQGGLSARTSCDGRGRPAPGRKRW